jgi:YVTN family beta-propeller protein
MPALPLPDIVSGLAINPSGHFLYATIPSLDIVSQIDLKTNKLVKNIEAGAGPIGLTMVGNNLYIADSTSGLVSVANVLTDQILYPVHVGQNPVAIDSGLDKRLVFVVNRGSNSISIVDIDTNSVKNITVGTAPTSIAVNPVTNMIYVVNSVSNKVSTIDYYIAETPDPFKFTKGPDISVGSHTNGITLNQNTNQIYVTNTNDDTVSVIDGNTNSVVGNITVGYSPYGIVVNPNDNKIYVANSGGDTVSVIDGNTNSVVGNITVGYSPAILGLDPDTRMIYATSLNNSTLYEINGTTNKVTVGVGINVDPPRSGQIDCNGKIFSNNDYGYMDVNTSCRPIENKGFKFTSWSGSLVSNPNNNQTMFRIKQFGTLIANFQRNSTPTSSQAILSNEALNSLYNAIAGPIITAVVLGPVASWLVPYIANLLDERKQKKYLGVYTSKIDNIYHELSYRDKLECLQSLAHIRIEVMNLFENGNINSSSYQILNDRISQYVNDVRSNPQ